MITETLVNQYMISAEDAQLLVNDPIWDKYITASRDNDEEICTQIAIAEKLQPRMTIPEAWLFLADKYKDAKVSYNGRVIIHIDHATCYGICEALHLMLRLKYINEDQHDEMMKKLYVGRLKYLNQYFFPLTEEDAKMRASLCKELANE